ncbi:Predicted PurR-regulated permease PerM [Ruania alba]|uniref:Predicted PurR-regulated permease PerM n=2 Tax=Ruania alba TaxID=648782 RepID=A0A1H5GRU3_9MICO|nr:Predicted PurR-regulated permease PerM [Ruania alba]
MPKLVRSPARGARLHPHRLPERHLSSDATGDGVPRWMVKAGGWSWRLLVVVAVVALLVWATAKIQLVFIAVFLALVFASVLRPFVNLMDKVMPRALATALSIFGAILVIGGMVTYVVRSVTGQWEDLSEEFTAGINELWDLAENLPFGVSITADQLREWSDTGLQWIRENQSELLDRAAEGAGSVFVTFAILALATFCTVFFLARGDEMWRWFINQLPARVRPQWIAAGGVGWYTFSGYARGTVIIALVDGVLALILLLIAGVPLAAPLAVLVFIGAFIPLVGAPAAMIVAMIVALAANGVWNAVIVGIAIALIGQFEGHVLQPLVMGKQVSLHPVVVALAVTSGTLVAGILGAVVVIPIVAVIWAVYAKLRTVDPPMQDLEEPDVLPRS